MLVRMPTKYALLIIPAPILRDPARVALAPGLTAWQGALQEVVGDVFDKSWREALGTLRVDELSRSSTFVMTMMASPRPRDLDGDSKRLANKLGLALHALRFFTSFDGQASVLSGEASPDGRSLLSVSNIMALNRVYQGSYARRSKVKSLIMKPADSLARWSATVRLLGRARRCPAILRAALNVYARAFEDWDMAFRLPHFVRAAEAVLAIPRKGTDVGAKAFARRPQVIAPELRNDPVVGRGLNVTLLKLYALGMRAFTASCRSRTSAPVEPVERTH